MAECELMEAASRLPAEERPYLLAAMRVNTQVTLKHWTDSCIYTKKMLDPSSAQDHPLSPPPSNPIADLPVWIRRLAHNPFARPPLKGESPLSQRRAAHAAAGKIDDGVGPTIAGVQPSMSAETKLWGHDGGGEVYEGASRAATDHEDDHDDEPHVHTGTTSHPATPPAKELFDVAPKTQAKRRFPNALSNQSNCKRREAEPKHGAPADTDDWKAVYSYILNVAASAPTDPEKLAQMAINILCSRAAPTGSHQRREPAQDVTTLTENDEVASILARAMDEATTASNNVVHAAWREVLDWIIVTSTYRQALALKAINPKKIFTETGKTNRSEVTRRNKCLGALRWIWLAHALGDLAFLPVLMLMGDIAVSLEKMRKMKGATFAALVEFIQTGEDGRNGEDVWREGGEDGALRGAARFTVKFYIPAVLRYMSWFLKTNGGDGHLPAHVHWSQAAGGVEGKTTVGLVAAKDASANLAPRDMRITLTGSAGFSITTPGNAVLAGSYKSLLADQVSEVERERINWLTDRSLYGQMVDGIINDPVTYIEPARLIPSYSLLMGLDLDEEAALLKAVDDLLNAPPLPTYPTPRNIADDHKGSSKSELRMFYLTNHLDYGRLNRAQAHELDASIWAAHREMRSAVRTPRKRALPSPPTASRAESITRSSKRTRCVPALPSSAPPTPFSGANRPETLFLGLSNSATTLEESDADAEYSSDHEEEDSVGHFRTPANLKLRRQWLSAIASDQMMEDGGTEVES
ncbi:hypothetical protein OC834_004038 [Tilletia horrida]|nr:hypothetical protein OC834_004038 [Tilletia horrida]